MRTSNHPKKSLEQLNFSLTWKCFFLPPSFSDLQALCSSFLESYFVSLYNLVPLFCRLFAVYTTICCLFSSHFLCRCKRWSETEYERFSWAKHSQFSIPFFAISLLWMCLFFEKFIGCCFFCVCDMWHVCDSVRIELYKWQRMLPSRGLSCHVQKRLFLSEKQQFGSKWPNKIGKNNTAHEFISMCLNSAMSILTNR